MMSHDLDPAGLEAAMCATMNIPVGVVERIVRAYLAATAEPWTTADTLRVRGTAAVPTSSDEDDVQRLRDKYNADHEAFDRVIDERDALKKAGDELAAVFDGYWVEGPPPKHIGDAIAAWNRAGESTTGRPCVKVDESWADSLPPCIACGGDVEWSDALLMPCSSVEDGDVDRVGIVHRSECDVALLNARIDEARQDEDFRNRRLDSFVS